MIEQDDNILTPTELSMIRKSWRQHPDQRRCTQQPVHRVDNAMLTELQRDFRKWLTTATTDLASRLAADGRLAAYQKQLRYAGGRLPRTSLL